MIRSCNAKDSSILDDGVLPDTWHGMSSDEAIQSIVTMDLILEVE